MNLRRKRIMPSCALKPVRSGTSVPGRLSLGLLVRKAPGTSGSTTGTNGKATVLSKSAVLPGAPARRAPAFTRSSLGVARR